MRTLLVWCPDWPVLAAGLAEGVDVHGPVVVLHANRVLACSPAARAEGVRRGLRKREAQGRCPQLVVVEHDPARDARVFESVVAAVEELAPGVEVIRPGACALAARGPSSYYGSEAAAVERLVEQVALGCGVEAQAGVADGVFAALLAARAGLIVPPGRTPEFLAGMDISTIDRPDLADLLRRLGVRTLADFAALPAGDVLARFGFDAAYVHRLAAGVDERPLAVRKPPPDLTVTEEYDPPLDRVDMAAFAARALAERLHARLAGHGLAATRLGIEARTAAGEELHRMWRHDGLLDAAGIADRLRWQLDGWLTAARIGTHRSTVDRPTAGIDRLRLVPDGVVRHAGLRSGLWGEIGEADERAHRALVRVQGLLGPDSVFTAVLGGGRDYADRVRLVPWGDERSPRRPGGDERSPRREPVPPWPGRLPAPAPAVVLVEPVPAVVRVVDGSPVSVDERLAMSGPPAWVATGRQPASEVTSWAGPWPIEERWWAPAEARQVCRLQVCLADGRTLLLALSSGIWTVEASYD
ncbi:MAG: DNA polymerase Y family protein [Micromonosporaceae bacterium]